ncbi:hypothetical protein KAU37_11380 [Candidatus Bipolaricaulota bacterium]|nr:hypothetical protein [Candidatus Bipolaricaulota bacterium]
MAEFEPLIDKRYLPDPVKVAEKKRRKEVGRKAMRLIWIGLGTFVFILILVSMNQVKEDKPKAPPAVESSTTVASSAEKAPSKQTTRAATPKRQTARPLEYQLALINVGRFVPEDDLSVARFRYLLRTIESKTFNTQQEIADMTVQGQKLLREEYGKEVKLLELMEAANDSIPPDYRMKYAEVMAALVVLTGTL